MTEEFKRCSPLFIELTRKINRLIAKHVSLKSQFDRDIEIDKLIFWREEIDEDRSDQIVRSVEKRQNAKCRKSNTRKGSEK